MSEYFVRDFIVSKVKNYIFHSIGVETKDSCMRKSFYVKMSCIFLVMFLLCFNFFNKNILRATSSISNLNIKHIYLDGAQNVRDLGGYFTQNNKITKWHLFLRSDNTNSLTDKDIKFLKDYGVKTVIDLRSKKEVSKCKDKFFSINGIKYFNISLEPCKMSDFVLDDSLSNDKMSRDYIMLLEYGKQSLKTIFHILAENMEDTILFHCVSGKDRTGLLTMLLLGLVGVHEADIVADYEISHTYIKDSKIFKLSLEKYGVENMLSSPLYLENVIKYIKNNYETFDKYLLSCGISNECLIKIKNKFSE